jgi:hypothetical protein
MPILRYFIFVGGALLALLFAANLVVPASPVAEQAVATAGNEQPMIRIRSDRQLPERVVLDTSQPPIAAPLLKSAAVAAPQQPVQADELAEMSAKARVRETFAQFTPSAQKADTASAKRADVKPQVPPRRKVARTHPAQQPGRSMMLVAQQPHFGLFNMTW